MNVVQALKDAGIQYVTEGKNVSPGNVNIRCPWCGDADPSEHMGINVNSGWYGCWRNSRHRGKQFEFLLATLVGCSVETARQRLTPDVSTLRQAVDRLAEPKTQPFKEGVPDSISIPAEWRPIRWSGLTSAYAFYLQERGFDNITSMCDYYGLSAALFGPFAQRIIFPVFYRQLLVAWTGRAIGKAELRYKSFPANETIKRHLLFYDNIHDRSADTLFITEGPIDALKLDWYGHQFGLRATCLFGKIATDAQVTKIIGLARRFSRVIVMLDGDAWSQTLDLYRRLATIKRQLVLLDEQLDPGKLRAADIAHLCRVLAIKGQRCLV